MRQCFPETLQRSPPPCPHAILVSDMNLTLDSKIALITGGSRGIGAATVRMFAAAGCAKVVFNYQNAVEQAEAISLANAVPKTAAPFKAIFRPRRRRSNWSKPLFPPSDASISW